MDLIDLAEEILYLISKKDKIEIGEIQDRFSLRRETVTRVIDFLVEFGFVQLDGSNRYITLSEACRRFFEEEKVTSQERESNSNTLAVVCLW